MPATLTAPQIKKTPVVESSPLQKLHGALRKSHFSPKQVQIQTNGGNVRLEGTVGTFYQKQMAQELVRRVDGVDQVENQLKVSWR